MGSERVHRFKGGDQQCEIDIIAVKADDKNVDIIEVKRNPDKFNRDFQ